MDGGVIALNYLQFASDLYDPTLKSLGVHAFVARSCGNNVQDSTLKGSVEADRCNTFVILHLALPAIAERPPGPMEGL